MTDKRCTIIGSRETPFEIFRLTVKLTYCLVEEGYAIYSGGCPLGMDKAAYLGMSRHKTSDRSRHRIYIGWNGLDNLYHDPDQGIIDPTRSPYYEKASELAEQARGGWYGLRKGGIALHSRNPFQVLGDDLNSPTDFVVCWAPLKKDGVNVTGGTGTAVRIALDRDIPVYNLIHSDVEASVREYIDGFVRYRRRR